MRDLKALEVECPGIKEWSRDDFVGNECGSDEYRETQPQKGFMYIAELWEFFESGRFTPEEEAEALVEVKAWIDRMIEVQQNPNKYKPWELSYAGAEKLEPLLTRLHDMCWLEGRHPYDGPDDPYYNDERIQWFVDERETQA